MKTKIGLLIDLNSFPHSPKDVTPWNDENSPDDTICSGSFSEPAECRLQPKVNQLQEFVLEQLTKEGTRGGFFNPSDVQFTYRYFNSSNYFHPVKELQGFVPFDFISFEAFEKSLETELRTICENEDDLCSSVNKLGMMSAAFKGMISDLDWGKKLAESVSSVESPGFPRHSSSSSVRSLDSASTGSDSPECTFKNAIYVFFRVPRNEADMETFVDEVQNKLDIAHSSKQFLSSFVPKAFLDMIIHNYQIRVNFVDMWFLDGNKSQTINYPISIPKVLRYLHGGQILLPVSKVVMDPGLPCWKTFLKNNLKAHLVTQLPAPGSISSCSGETTHVSDSSRYSTPVQQQSQHNQSKIQLLKKTIEGSSSSAKSESTRKGLNFDRTRLRKNAIGNTQAHNFSHSQPSLSRASNRDRSHQRFSSKSNQTILLQKNAKPISLSRNTDFVRYNSAPAPAHEEPHSSRSCPNPKKVRRNLFSGSPHSQVPSESIQRLLASSARFHFPGRSPSRSSSSSGSLLFTSPHASSCPSEFKSPGSTNVLKSRRQLGLGDLSGSCSRSPLPFGSPVNDYNMLRGIICPESPATPPPKRTKTSVSSSSEKTVVVQESPEAAPSLNVFKKSRFTRHDSFTFYSSSSSDSLTSKSRVWEESGKKLQAARIKDSVDLSQIASSSQSLSLEDLDFIDSPPAACRSISRQSMSQAELHWH